MCSCRGYVGVEGYQADLGVHVGCGVFIRIIGNIVISLTTCSALKATTLGCRLLVRISERLREQPMEEIRWMIMYMPSGSVPSAARTADRRCGSATKRATKHEGEGKLCHDHGPSPAALFRAHRESRSSTDRNTPQERISVRNRGSRSKIRDAEADIGRYELRDAQSRIGELRSSFVSLRSRKNLDGKQHGRIKREVGSSSIHTHIENMSTLRTHSQHLPLPQQYIPVFSQFACVEFLSTHSSVLVWVSLVVAQLCEDIATDNHGQTLHLGARLVAGAEVKECDVVEIS